MGIAKAPRTQMILVAQRKISLRQDHRIDLKALRERQQRPKKKYYETTFVDTDDNYTESFDVNMSEDGQKRSVENVECCVQTCLVYFSDEKADAKLAEAMGPVETAGLSERIIECMAPRSVQRLREEKHISWDPLIIFFDAAIEGNTEELIKVLPKIECINTVMGAGLSALHHAAMRGHLGCVKMLLNAGADPNTREPFNGWTPLHVALLSNTNVEVISALLKAGADAELEDSQEESPVCMASSGHPGKATIMACLRAKYTQPRVTALYSYDAQHDDELSFKRGQLITVTDRNNEDRGWWLACIDDRCGLVPRTHVQ